MRYITEIFTALLVIFITFLFDRLFRRVAGARLPNPSTSGEGRDQEGGGAHVQVHWSTEITEEDPEPHVDHTETTGVEATGTQEEEFVMIDHLDALSIDRTIIHDDVSRVVGQPRMMALLRTYAILGAVIIGYSNNFLGGVFSMPVFFLRTTPKLFAERELATANNYCQFSSFDFLILVSTVPLCSVVIGWVGFFVSNMHGRKLVTFIACLLMILGVPLALTLPRASTIVGLVLIGCGAGLFSRIVPTLCSESVPTALQRHFSAMSGYTISGSALAYLVNYIASYYPEDGWRLPFIVLGSLSGLLARVSYFVEETPVFLIENGRYQDALGRLIRLRHGRLLRDITLELDQIRDDTLEAAQKNKIKELFHEDHIPTFLIPLLSSVFPLLMSTVPVVFFGPLVTTSLDKTVVRVPFLVSLVGGLAGLVATLLTSWGLPTLRRRRLLIGFSLAATISSISLFAIFLKYTHPNVIMAVGASIATTSMMVVNHVATTVLSNPHGWINTSLGAAGSVGDLIISSLSSIVTVFMNCLSVRLVCDSEHGGSHWMQCLTACVYFSFLFSFQRALVYSLLVVLDIFGGAIGYGADLYLGTS